MTTVQEARGRTEHRSETYRRELAEWLSTQPEPGTQAALVSQLMTFYLRFNQRHPA